MPLEFEKIVQRVNSITDSDSDGIRNAFEGLDNPKLFPKGCKFIGTVLEHSDTIS
jgi:hypothetical protein